MSTLSLKDKKVDLARVVLHAHRAAPRTIEIALMSNDALQIMVGPPRTNLKALDMMWAWRQAPAHECRLVFYPDKKYATLWAGIGIAFDLTLAEAEQVKRVFAQFGLKVMVGDA